jgi:hypothetical protein
MMKKEEATPEKGCTCGCGCECCQEDSAEMIEDEKEGIFWQMRMNDSVGAIFLGILAILLLVFLVRANRRNRELLLEVIQLRPQA